MPHALLLGEDGQELEKIIIPDSDASELIELFGSKGFTLAKKESQLVEPLFVNNFQNSKYSVYKERVTYAEAVRLADLAGGKLVEVGSAEEDAFLRDWLDFMAGSHPLFWIGLHRDQADDSWLTTDEKIAPVFEAWATGQTEQPSGAEGCAALSANRENPLSWVSVPCGSSYQFILEFQGSELPIEQQQHTDL